MSKLGIRRGLALLGVGVLVGAIPPELQAAYLDDGPPRDERPVPSEPVRPLPPRPRPPLDGHPLKTVLRGVTIGPARRFGHLTLYPLQSVRSHRSGVISLDEALRHGRVEIQEWEHARVNALRMRNTGARPVLVLAGEMIAGGKQNRIVREDVLLPTESGFISVPVYCGEKERWTARPAPFAKSDGLADVRIRRMAVQDAPQQGLWQEIDSRMEAAGVESPTRDYRKLYVDDRLRREVDDHVKALRPVVNRQTLGVVAVAHGRIAGADLFADPALLADFWEKICRSYAFSACTDRIPPRHAYAPGGDEVRRFLHDARRAQLTPAATPGAGRLWRIHGRAHGRALTQHHELVHAALFAGAAVNPPPDDPPPIEPYRTDDQLWR